jgi:hypothetical protein
MVQYIPPPDPHRLLPPVLACLPTAFSSRRPPPALLPLVSPILRQRFELITSTSPSSSENWLRLLCWDREKGSRLQDVVENGTYEPHPSSGEIEVGDTGLTRYKRLDQDTLRAQILLPEWTLTALYLWCPEGEGDSGWKLAELLPYDADLERDPTWSQSINAANQSARGRMVSEALRDAEAAEQPTPGLDDDADYWAQYDKTPGRSPGRSTSPARAGVATDRSVGHSEGEYFARYSEVQPAMDNQDPSGAFNDMGNSSLHGDILARMMKQQARGIEGTEPILREAVDLEAAGVEAVDTPVNQPKPSPSSPASSGAVARLEEIADQQSASEIGIRQHIGSTVKSLYRLAKSAGIEREEFNRIVQTELETNSILDN